MDTENKDELFSLKLNEQGIESINRFARTVRIYLVLGIILVTISLVSQVLSVNRFNRNSGDWLMNLYFKLYPVLNFIVLLILFLQVVYFRKFSVLLQKAVNENDELTFNSAFKILNRIGWIVLCDVLLGFVYILVNMLIAFT